MHKNCLSIIRTIERPYLKQDLPEINVGDSIKIGLIIQEGNRERVQFSEGVIISINRAHLNTSITVRRVFQGIGIEKVYLIHSQRITKIEIVKRSKIRRAKLYYLRDKSGKATRLKQKFTM